MSGVADPEKSVLFRIYVSSLIWIQVLMFDFLSLEGHLLSVTAEKLIMMLQNQENVAICSLGPYLD